jgi:soluble lytic murein transglycosylase-like protein
VLSSKFGFHALAIELRKSEQELCCRLKLKLHAAKAGGVLGSDRRSDNLGASKGPASMDRFTFVVVLVVILFFLGGPLPSRAQTKKNPPTTTPSEQTGQQIIGKRVVFVDGQTLDVDDAWKNGDSIWIKRNGTSQMLNRPVKRIEDRFKATDAGVSAAAAPKSTRAPEPLRTWIYLNDGARLRVDEVRQVSDGAWYNRGKLTIFLARERIARIEVEDPNVATEDWKGHGWSSGNLAIDQLIRQNASRFAVDPYLVFLVIEQESQFHTRARSPKGAQGLMQLMPGTARRFGVSKPYDPAQNIRGGTQYLKQLLTMFNGQVDLALASYNAGEGRVLDYGNRVPPFKETRDYVKKISARYRNHKAPDTTKTKMSVPRR